MAFKSCIQSPKSIEELKSLIVEGKIILPGKRALLARAMFERPVTHELETPWQLEIYRSL